MTSRLSRVLPIALFAACSLSGPALAQTEPSEGDECFEECTTGPPAPQVANRYAQADYLTAVLRRGHPFLCGNAADAKRSIPEVDCRVEAKITVPAKVAKYLGLSSRVLAEGVASNKTDHYMDDRQDMGRAYFLRPAGSLKAKLKAKKVRGLGVIITGKITVVGVDKIMCSDAETPRASCPLDYGRKPIGWRTADSELVCWPVMPWWVAIKTAWGKMCPKPINA